MAWRKGFTVRVAVYGTILVVLVTLAWLAMPSVHGPMASNEASAVTALRTYLGAQGTFKRHPRYHGTGIVCANPRDGTGFPDLYRVGGPGKRADGMELKLIDLALARATSSSAGKAGYWFIDIVGDWKTGLYDFTRDCGLCAVAARHGKSGLRTFIINVEGAVYMKDNGGRPVTVFPDVAKDGWRAVE